MCLFSSNSVQNKPRWISTILISINFLIFVTSGDWRPWWSQAKFSTSPNTGGIILRARKTSEKMKLWKWPFSYVIFYFSLPFTSSPSIFLCLSVRLSFFLRLSLGSVFLCLSVYLSLVSWLLSLVSCLLSLVSCLLSLVSCQLLSLSLSPPG